MPVDVKRNLDLLLLTFSLQVLNISKQIHGTGVLGCRDCFVCKEIVPQMEESLVALERFQRNGQVWSERVLVPSLLSALNSCGIYWNKWSSDWRGEIRSFLEWLCFWLEEKQFHEERKVWEPLIRAFSGKSLEEIVTEMLSEERLEDIRDKAMEELFNGKYENLFVYAAPDIERWEYDNSGWDGDNET